MATIIEFEEIDAQMEILRENNAFVSYPSAREMFGKKPKLAEVLAHLLAFQPVVEALLNAHDGDTEDAATIAQLCKCWRLSRGNDENFMLRLLVPLEAWLARKSVSKVLTTMASGLASSEPPPRSTNFSKVANWHYPDLDNYPA